MAIRTGDIIADRYELLEEVGSGGMGVVFRASDRQLEGENIALKLIRSHLADDDRMFRRFVNEVVVARGLSHPSIVRIFDLGKTNEGLQYISMEYIDGPTLAEILESRKGKDRLQFAQILVILKQVAEALHAAHESGVIHRDLKPANILLSRVLPETKNVKVVDFGTARILGRELSLTQTGQIIGTPSYLSPEQIKGDELDHRCDLYAFGVICFECVMGRLPFEAESGVALAYKHLQEEIPEITPESAPEWFRSLIKELTRKNPSERIESFTQVLEIFSQHTQEMQSAEKLDLAEVKISRKRDELGTLDTGRSRRYELGSKEIPLQFIPPKREQVRKLRKPLLFLFLFALVGLVASFGGVIKEMLRPKKTIQVVNTLPYDSRKSKETEKTEEKILSEFDQYRNEKTGAIPLPGRDIQILDSIDKNPKSDAKVISPSLPRPTPSSQVLLNQVTAPTPVKSVTPEIKTLESETKEDRKPMRVSALEFFLATAGERAPLKNSFSAGAVRDVAWVLRVKGDLTNSKKDPLQRFVIAVFSGTEFSSSGSEAVVNLHPRTLNLAAQKNEDNIFEGGFEALEGILPDVYRLEVRESGRLLFTKTIRILPAEITIPVPTISSKETQTPITELPTVTATPTATETPTLPTLEELKSKLNANENPEKIAPLKVFETPSELLPAKDEAIPAPTIEIPLLPELSQPNTALPVNTLPPAALPRARE
jgi:serine/threonine protein kinase